MIANLIKIVSLAFILTALSSFPSSASDLNIERSIVGQSVNAFSSLLNSNTFLVKRGQPYDESRDPVLQSGGPETESPQHGYFAVPLLVLGLAGILLYFSRND